MRRFVFHKSLAQPGTATLMLKTNRSDTAPRVAARPGQSPDKWADTEPPKPSDLLDIMVEVLDGGY